MTQILLVEDDLLIAREIVKQLEQNGLQVTHLKTLAQVKLVQVDQFSLAIMDWNLPDGEGVDVVADWRRRGFNIPVLMLTAKTELEDRKVAQQKGVNDFLGKPFYFHELLGRIKVMVEGLAASAANLPAIYESGDIKVNRTERRVWHKNSEVMMTKKELDLLLFFINNPNSVFTRDEILDSVWGEDENPTNRTVDTHILQLRKKLSAEFFQTVWSTGYRFVPNPNQVKA